MAAATPPPPPLAVVPGESFGEFAEVAQENLQGQIEEKLHEDAHPPSRPDEEDQAHMHEMTGWKSRLSRMKETLSNTVDAVKHHIGEAAGSSASEEEHRRLIETLFEKICSVTTVEAETTEDVHEIAALFIWAVLAKNDVTLHKLWANDKHMSMERKLLSLTPEKLAAVRDAVDIMSDGIGFLPLVLATGNKSFYILLNEPRPQYLGLKIFSDIDDTFMAGWLDTPIGQVYPGVRELFAELLAYRNPPETLKSQVQMIFLSARPQGAQGKSISDLRSKGAGYPSDGHFVVLYGKLLPDILAAVDTLAMGKEKVSMFKLYRGLYPHFLYLFFGDTGQGDADTGEGMFNLHSAADRPIAVFLHEVRPPSVLKTRKIGENYIYHNFYAEARARAVSRGYLPPVQAQ